MKNRTEKEHYIPNKSYLDYFVDKTLKPKALWVYFNKKVVFKDASKETPKNITPINLCKESYLYETPRLPVNSIEKMLKLIEDNYKKVLDTKIIPRKRLNVDDRMAVAYFISTLEMRTPLNKSNSDQFISDIKEHVVHLEHQYAKGEKSKFHKELDGAEKQNLMFTQTLLSATQMNRYQVTDMLFLSPKFEDEESFFVTSDFPVCMVDFTLMNDFFPPTPLHSTVEITIPLTPRITLLINNLGLNGYKDIDLNYVWEINNRTLQRSNKFIISPKILSNRFTDLNVKRYPQSFVVLFLSDYIKKKRVQRTNNYMRRTLIKIVKSIALSQIKYEKKGNITIRSRNEQECEWFIRALSLIGIIRTKTKKCTFFDLKKSIRVGNKVIDHIAVTNTVKPIKNSLN